MTPLVLVPGLMCDARLFAPQIAALSGERDIILPNVTRRVSIANMAKDVLAAAPHRFAICGLSMGGIIAMEVMRQAPDRIERIALLDTSHLAESDAQSAWRTRQMLAARDGDLARVMREEMKPNYLFDGPGRREVLDLCMDMALTLGPHVFLRQCRALMDRIDQSETLRAMDVPSLVLCGRHDALCPVERHETMAALIPNAQLAIVEEAGHLPTLEQPDPVNVSLKTWLEA